MRIVQGQSCMCSMHVQHGAHCMRSTVLITSSVECMMKLFKCALVGSRDFRSHNHSNEEMALCMVSLTLCG